MNLANHPDTTDLAIAQSQALQAQLIEISPQLSIEHLQTLTDFAAYLLDKASHEATQELSTDPNLLTKLKQAQSTPTSQFKNWRELRSDV
ncbi:hypothetical protein C7B65_18545 [Phormidesmis priestleyi ULC007]|uniref:Uncharacterized protein n=1 Tax=Phormidesmis priestleyi ULC007 TaxID=1920490 RepID=A0A2T1DAD8_9CYAN|nr:hypothetical protein [Phormidesmis priestleyi]PSB17427.1 hypothetical protein C7B65_18545 [Phormidesmis priestleyi ULC007]PZO48377.1 MAG: hypothetical protein DCF14_17010 [Phormidesmis priestleyi]